ncbi:MAG: glycosyltransferase family 1 protein [Candidatus Omnitrophota bacterium]|nr:glycosyltransferase family 1 protein [Candidatus Omnitrophota bacterium]MDZ4241617.1 glycosyltransferase family 1 protein [Candidatus Omnitrophota bacterium]
MNVCIESQVLNHPRRSGLMTYTEGLVNGVHRNDRANAYALVYYSLRRSADGMPGPSDGNFRKAVLRVPDRPFWGRQALIDDFLLPAFLKKSKIQVFHRPAGYTMPDVKGVFKILTVHDLRTLTIGDSRWAQNIEKYKRALNALDACAVVSECTKRDLVQHFKIDEKKIRVTYLGADDRFRPAPDRDMADVKARYGLDQPFLLSVGSVPRKNIDGIIRGFAASRSKDQFLLALSCNMDVEKYQSLAQDLGVGPRLRILRNLKDADIVALYSACHCFVFPSLYEGFGLPILEAMQCGAPVITANSSSCPEVAGDAGILVNPAEPAEIAEAIDQVCRDEQLRKRMIEKGFQQAKKFGWDRFANQMKEIYDRG